MENTGNADQSQTNGAAENKTQDMVAYDSYRKVVGASKAKDAKLNEVIAENEALKQAQMEAEGKKDEVITSLKSRLSETEAKLSTANANFAWDKVSGEIKVAAIQEGCVNPDKLLTLLGKDGLEGLQVGDDYKVNGDDLSRLLDKAKKDHSDIGLFKSKSVNINDPVITNKRVEKKVKSIGDMTVAELKEQYLNVNK